MRLASLATLATLLLSSSLVAAQTTTPEPTSAPDAAPEEADDAGEADASSSGSHVAYGKRNITTPQGTIAVNAGPASNLDLNGGIVAGGFIFGLDFGLNIIPIANKFCSGGTCVEVDTPDPSLLLLGGAFGITQDLEVGALVLPLALSPDVEYLDPAVWGRYRLLTGDIEVAGQVLFFIPVDSSDAVIELGAPVRFRGDLRVDTGLYLRIETDGDFGLRLPATVAYNVTQEIFVGGRTGLNIPSFDNIDNGWVPLEALVGYTIPGSDGPLVDITLVGGFPLFLALGDRIGFSERIITEILHIGLGANGYFSIL